MMARSYSTANRPRRTRKASGARAFYDPPESNARSKAHLEANPHCVSCGDPATINDHITPVRPDYLSGP